MISLVEVVNHLWHAETNLSFSTAWVEPKTLKSNLLAYMLNYLFNCFKTATESWADVVAIRSPPRQEIEHWRPEPLFKP